MGNPVLVSIQVGKPRSLGRKDADDPMDQRWRTGFFKEPVAGPVWLGKTNLEGDGQADRRFHGGPDQAALCYSADHYPLWRAELEMPELSHGGFGENFTMERLREETVCIGDTYQIGEVRVQVSKTRGPCWKIERRWRRPGLLERVIATGRTGWYIRVLQEGHVEAGMEIRLLERGDAERTIARINAEKFKKQNR